MLSKINIPNLSNTLNCFLNPADIYCKTTMEDLNNQITLIRTELNLEQDPQKKQDLNKRLNVLNLKKEIETIKKRIEQIGWKEI